MPPFVVLLTNLFVSLLLLVIAGVGPRLQSPLWLLAVAVPPLLDAALLVAFVFGEDDYRGNGITRWDAYRSPGGALGPMFVISIAVLCLSIGLLTYAGRAGRHRLFRSTLVACALTCLFLVTPTIIGFSTN